MGHGAKMTVAWAMRRSQWTPAQAEHFVHALADAALDACAVHFPASEGYETRATSLHGMVEGVRVCVSKGEFSAVVSTQCYLEPGPAGPQTRELALRQVAALRPFEPHEVPTLRVVGLARPVLLLLGASVLLFALISSLTAAGLGGFFRLSLWMSFMIMMAPAVAWMLGARSTTQMEALDAARCAFIRETHAIAEHESRWRRLLRNMHDRQALVMQQRALPFRRG